MPSDRRKTLGRITPVHPYQWLWEPLHADPTFLLRSMFGAKAAYVNGKLMLCFCAGKEPWRGVLVCTEREFHPALRDEFPELSPHPILPKWLYLPETLDAFETIAARLVRCALRRDSRLGIVPRPRKKKQPSAARTRRRKSPRP